MFSRLFGRFGRRPARSGVSAPLGARARPPAPSPRGAELSAPSPDRERELLLYKYDACPWCRRVLAEVDRLGLDVPTADTREDPAARDALIALSGRSQVPCLVIDGVPLLESADINQWLAAYANRP